MALFSSQQAAVTPRPAARQEGEPVVLKEYDVVIDGRPTTLQLSDEDARAHGLHVPAHRAPQAQPEAEAPESAPETKAADAPANKARTAANKARTPADKGDDAG